MRFIVTFLFFICQCTTVYCNNTDSLLNILENSLLKKQIYFQQKENHLLDLKEKFNHAKTKEEKYFASKQIMEEYSYFISDSALFYSDKSLQLALDLNNKDYILDMKLERAYLLCFPQLFYESFKILESIDPEKISISYKRKYYNTYIHVFHNQIKDLNNLSYVTTYRDEQTKYINNYLSIADEASIGYLAILAYKYYTNGMVDEAVHTSKLILQHHDITPQMHAEFLLNIAGVIMESGKENWPNAKEYLIQASIEYNELVINKNPALMYLSKIIQEEKNTGLAFKFVNIAMEDSRKFSNSHRHSIAEQTYTLIQNTYYDKINEQQTRLQYYAALISLSFILLTTLFIFLYRRNRILKRTKIELFNINAILKEQNHLKKAYIGHYITMYSAHIIKFENYRKFIIRNLKSGNYEDLLKSESSLLDKTQNEIELLFSDFDRTFLELYPNFIESINNLLIEENHYIIKTERTLNTELRILALLKLGISDNKIISSFLRITVQTVYNYRSKIKSKAVNIDKFEDEVKRIAF